MTYKLKLLIATILSTLIVCVCGYSGTVKALPALTFYFNADSGFEDSLILGDSNIPFLMIDEESYTVSEDVTSVEFILKDPNGLIVPNMSDIGGYYFEFTSVGQYSLEVYIENTTDANMLEYTISVTKEFDTSTLGSILEVDSITDTALSSALLKVFQKLYKEQYGSVCNILNPYTDMFMSVEIDTLDLSGCNISSLNGMQYLNFNNLNSLILSNNNLSSVKKEYLDDEYTTLTHLDISNNKITEVDISNLNKLESINVANNLLTAIDLAHINVGTDKACNINLAHNNITNVDNVKVPLSDTKYSALKLNLMSNYIGTPKDTWVSNPKITLVLGLQLKQVEKTADLVTESNNTDTTMRISHTYEVCYYKTNMAPDLKLIIYTVVQDIDGADVLTPYKTIVEATMTENVDKFTLPCGEYKYKYYLGDEEAYSNTNDRRIYKSDNFISIPNEPTHYLVHNGKKYDTLSKVIGYVTVRLNPYESDENIKLYYKVNGGTWVEGDKVTVQGGTNIISVKAVSANGYESQEKLIYVQTSLNPYVPDFLLLIFIVFLLIMVVFVAVPLLGKWLNSDKK